jgi:flavin prenyltransferase
MNPANKIILAVTGATGMLYLDPLLTLLGEQGVTVHGIISDAGRKVLHLERANGAGGAAQR